MQRQRDRNARARGRIQGTVELFRAGAVSQVAVKTAMATGEFSDMKEDDLRRSFLILSCKFFQLNSNPAS